MKITKIEVENFKSIESYRFEISDFNIFVGQNNHGKTNLFSALDWFDSGKTQKTNYYLNEENRIIKVRVEYAGVQEALNNLDNETYKARIIGVIGESDTILLEKTSEDDKRSIIINGQRAGNPTGFDAALNYFLPKIEYVTTQTHLSDVSGYKAKSPIAEMLAGVLESVVQDEPKYREFLNLFDEIFNGNDGIFRTAVNNLETKVEHYLQKQFAENTEIDFKIDNPKIEDMLKGFETSVDDGIKTKAEHKGDGMQRAIMLAIIQAYADYRKEKGIVRNFVFLIDEAELHLHPSAQRSLKKALRDIVNNGGQVFVNTHSSVFANEEFPNQKMYNVKKIEGQSKLELIETQQQRMDSIFLLLGGSPNDLLLPSNFIIVEGQSELKFLQKIIERFYSSNQKCVNIKILFARGDTRMGELYQAIHDCYRPLLTNGVYKNQTVFLFDKPRPDKIAKFNEFKSAHNWLQEGEQIHIIPEFALEMYYPGIYKKTEEEVRILEEERKKVEYAGKVGEEITFEQFRDEMPVIYTMLSKAIEKAYE